MEITLFEEKGLIEEEEEEEGDCTRRVCCGPQQQQRNCSNSENGKNYTYYSSIFLNMTRFMVVLSRNCLSAVQIDGSCVC